MTRKVETKACSPAPGGTAEDFLPVDTNDNNSSGDPPSDKSNTGNERSTDFNANSKANLKYGLRPRSVHSRSPHFDEDVECDLALKQKSTKVSKRGSGSGRNRKPRFLSRYKRKNANARERDRMREINVAFDALKGALPTIISPKIGVAPHGDEGETTTITKISTLRLAAGYIQALQDILDADERGETTDDADSAYSWLLSSLLHEDMDEEACQVEDTSDDTSWALPYFINQGKRSLPTDVSTKIESPCSYTLKHSVQPPLKRLKHEHQLEYFDKTNEGKCTFICTESTKFEVEHLTPYSTTADSDILNLLLDQKTNFIPSYDTLLVKAKGGSLPNYDFR